MRKSTPGFLYERLRYNWDPNHALLSCLFFLLKTVLFFFRFLRNLVCASKCAVHLAFNEHVLYTGIPNLNVGYNWIPNEHVRYNWIPNENVRYNRMPNETCAVQLDYY